MVLGIEIEDSKTACGFARPTIDIPDWTIWGDGWQGLSRQIDATPNAGYGWLGVASIAAIHYYLVRVVRCGQLLAGGINVANNSRTTH
jgi:hypothetical protein